MSAAIRPRPLNKDFDTCRERLPELRTLRSELSNMRAALARGDALETTKVVDIYDRAKSLVYINEEDAETGLIFVRDIEHHRAGIEAQPHAINSVVRFLFNRVRRMASILGNGESSRENDASRIGQPHLMKEEDVMVLLSGKKGVLSNDNSEPKKYNGFTFAELQENLPALQKLRQDCQALKKAIGRFRQEQPASRISDILDRAEALRVFHRDGLEVDSRGFVDNEERYLKERIRVGYDAMPVLNHVFNQVNRAVAILKKTEAGYKPSQKPLYGGKVPGFKPLLP